jgi:hypothetical protein
MFIYLAVIGLIVVPALWDITKNVRSLRNGRRELWGKTYTMKNSPNQFWAINLVAIALELALIAISIWYLITWYSRPGA